MLNVSPENVVLEKQNLDTCIVSRSLDISLSENVAIEWGPLSTNDWALLLETDSGTLSTVTGDGIGDGALSSWTGGVTLRQRSGDGASIVLAPPTRDKRSTESGISFVNVLLSCGTNSSHAPISLKCCFCFAKNFNLLIARAVHWASTRKAGLFGHQHWK